MDDIFAEIGFDRLDIVGFKKRIKRDFLADHRFGFGDCFRIIGAADIQHCLTRFFRCHAPMDHTAAFLDLVGETLKVKIEMLERVIFYLHCLVAERLELR